MAEKEDTKIHVGVLTVSDSCSRGAAADISGQKLNKLIDDGIIPNAEVII